MMTATRPPRILVFDSGVGGLSILAEIRARLPSCEFTYASDNEAFPYGTKSETELISRVDQVLRKLLQDYAIDVLVIACNTASTLALPHIRSHFTQQPIVGVVPAIKPAAARSSTKVIGLLATPATIVRPYTHNLIRQYARNKIVISVGSSELVHLAEQKLRGTAVIPEQLASILAPFYEHPDGNKMDTLVLACTHFPLLRAELQQALPVGVELIDSGAAIARRVEYLLNKDVRYSTTTASTSGISHRAVFTQNSPSAAQLRMPLAQFGISNLDFLIV